MTAKASLEPIEPSSNEEVPTKLEFDDLLFHAADYVHRRKPLFIKISIAVIVVLAIVWGIFQYLDYSKNQRAEQLFSIEQVLHSNQTGSQEHFDLALSKINLFLHDHSGTDEAIIVLFRRSYLYAGRNMFVEAEADLKESLSLLDDDSPFKPIAGIYLANILKDQNKGAEAIGILESVRSDTMIDIVLMELAETYIETKQVEEAKQTLISLLQDFPNSLYSKKAKAILDRL